jgi:F-type H+-transporting ATPase subunit delta
MKHTSISKRYAAALAESVPDNAELEAVAGEIAALTQLFRDHPDLGRFAGNRALHREARQRFLESILDRLELIPVTRRFMLLLVDKGRIGLLAEISSSLAELVDLRLNRAEAVVTTAVPLNDEQRERLRLRLSELTGKTIRMKEQRDPDILGGVVVQIGTRVIDGSVKSSLSKMREELLAEA